jgi:hypothetical protein
MPAVVRDTTTIEHALHNTEREALIQMRRGVEVTSTSYGRAVGADVPMRREVNVFV